MATLWFWRPYEQVRAATLLARTVGVLWLSSVAAAAAACHLQSGVYHDTLPAFSPEMICLWYWHHRTVFTFTVNVCICKVFHIANTLESTHTTGARMSSLLAALSGGDMVQDSGAVTSEEYFLSFLCQSHNFTRDSMEKWWGFLSLPSQQPSSNRRATAWQYNSGTMTSTPRTPQRCLSPL